MTDSGATPKDGLPSSGVHSECCAREKQQICCDSREKHACCGNERDSPSQGECGCQA